MAPSTLGSAHWLTAKRGTPFSPRAHYKLGTWFWGRRYSRWPRPHEFGIHDFYTWPTRCYAFEPCHLVSYLGWLVREFAYVRASWGAGGPNRPHPLPAACQPQRLSAMPNTATTPSTKKTEPKITNPNYPPALVALFGRCVHISQNVAGD
jgi:hypothetical protein